MRLRQRLWSLLLPSAWIAAAIALCAACGGAKISPEQRAESERLTAAAVAALAKSDFSAARSTADAALAKDRTSSRAAAVRAIAAYQAAGSRLRNEVTTLLDSDDVLAQLDREAGRAIWQRFGTALSAVAADLEVVANDPAFSLELCLACWEHDWNHSGEVDDNDRRLFEIEYERGDTRAPAALPEGDPRRRPTFRFDVGDAHWALAMISFQRAAVELILAYRWSEVVKLFAPQEIVPSELEIPLRDPGSVRRARELVIAGLGHADRCRGAYLAETDDDREWVPSPKQKSYAVPLPLDATIYQTWAEITADVRRMLRSEEGLSLRELAALGDDDAAVMMPAAFIDVGAMLRDPKPLIVQVASLRQLDDRDPAKTQPLIEKILRGVLGNGYSTSMKPSQLPRRLSRMQRELSDGEDTFERKLRYLLWLN